MRCARSLTVIAIRFGEKRIRTSLMLVAVSSCFGAAYLSLLPAFARDLLHGDATSYGTLMTGVGIGALIGAYALSRVRERWLTLAPIAASACFGLGLIAFSHSHTLWLSVALILPTAFSLMLLGGTTNTIIQLAASEHMRGRVISHYTQAFLGMMPWGSLHARRHRRPPWGWKCRHRRRHHRRDFRGDRLFQQRSRCSARCGGMTD